jgi:DNA-binding NarL/FixJ family response regulator
MRILVVDDHETLRPGIYSILEARKNVGICREAANGQEAVEKATEFVNDLTILDVTMPRLDGFAAAGQIRIPPRGAHSYALSMHETHRVARETQQAGAQAFVSKSAAGRGCSRHWMQSFGAGLTVRRDGHSVGGASSGFNQARLAQASIYLSKQVSNRRKKKTGGSD